MGLSPTAQGSPGEIRHACPKPHRGSPKCRDGYLKVTACFPCRGWLSLLDMVISIPSPSSTSWTWSRDIPVSVPVPFPSAPSSRDRSCP